MITVDGRNKYSDYHLAFCHNQYIFFQDNKTSQISGLQRATSLKSRAFVMTIGLEIGLKSLVFLYV